MNNKEIEYYLRGIKDILGDRPPTKEEWDKILAKILEVNSSAPVYRSSGTLPYQGPLLSPTSIC